MIEIILNFVIVLVLAITIAFCIRLERRINNLRSKKNEITDALVNLDKTLNSSQKNLEELKELGATTLYKLNQQNEISKELIKDMEFITDHGNKLADKLEELISQSKKSIDSIEKTIKKAESSRKSASKTGKKTK